MARLTRTTVLRGVLIREMCWSKMAYVKEGDERIKDFAKRFLKATKESLSEVHQTLQIQTKRRWKVTKYWILHRNNTLKGNRAKQKRNETDWRKKSVSFKVLITRNCKIQRSIKTGTIFCPAIIPDGGCFPNSDENTLFLSVYLSF